MSLHMSALTQNLIFAKTWGPDVLISAARIVSNWTLTTSNLRSRIKQSSSSVTAFQSLGGGYWRSQTPEGFPFARTSALMPPSTPPGSWRSSQSRNGNREVLREICKYYSVQCMYVYTWMCRFSYGRHLRFLNVHIQVVWRAKGLKFRIFANYP